MRSIFDCPECGKEGTFGAVPVYKDGMWWNVWTCRECGHENKPIKSAWDDDDPRANFD